MANGPAPRRLRLRRGLLRLWTAISLLWLVPVAIFGAGYYQESDAASGIWVYIAQEKKFQVVDWRVTHSNLSATAKEWDASIIKVEGDKAVLLISNTFSTAEKEAILERYWRERWQRRVGPITDIALVGLSPPILLLLLGLLFAWVIRGFGHGAR